MTESLAEGEPFGVDAADGEFLLVKATQPSDSRGVGGSNPGVSTRRRMTTQPSHTLRGGV